MSTGSGIGAGTGRYHPHLGATLPPGMCMSLQVTILFTDICSFTDMSRQVEPSAVMHFLNTLYSLYDRLLDTYNVYKVWPTRPSISV